MVIMAVVKIVIDRNTNSTNNSSDEKTSGLGFGASGALLMRPGSPALTGAWLPVAQQWVSECGRDAIRFHPIGAHASPTFLQRLQVTNKGRQERDKIHGSRSSWVCVVKLNGMRLRCGDSLFSRNSSMIF